MKPVLLDLYCGGGGASKGYADAGFRVIGIDRLRNQCYPFEYLRAEVLAVLFHLLDGGRISGLKCANLRAIHASPPCQRFCPMTPPASRHLHYDLIGVTRDLLQATGRPYIIENVPAAQHLLRRPITLCGSQFGLPIIRHRCFESNVQLDTLLPACDHPSRPVLITGQYSTKGRKVDYSLQQKRDAMRTPWLTARRITEAIPPAYTEHMGRQLLRIT